MATIQRVTSGIYKFGLASENKGRASIPGSIFISVDGNTNITGDIRVHDGIRLGGISVPPPGTVAHMIPIANTSPLSETGFDARDGWLFCDGSILDKKTYGALYDAIGEYWNTDPSITSTQFQIPDLRGYFIRCYNPSRPFGAESRQEDTVKKHAHYCIVNPAGGHTHNYVSWETTDVTGLPNTTDPTKQPGVLNDTSKPGHNSRYAYAIAQPSGTSVESLVAGNKNIMLSTQGTRTGWNETAGSADPVASDPNKYYVLGESFTRPVDATLEHKHYIRTGISEQRWGTVFRDPSSSIYPETSYPEGVCFNVKIPAFIKY